MKIIKKIKSLNEEQRRTVVVFILLFLALPLVFLVFRNFNGRIKILNQTAGLKMLQSPEITPETSRSIDELRQAKEDFDGQMELLEEWENFSTSTIDTSTMSTSVNETGF
ncbi:MAG: hypothetical protein PHU56_03470 [Candidatus Pacebacteria bacterium]|nr:hypothetical protein [Candidatus Paceibacterota bacterium]